MKTRKYCVQYYHDGQWWSETIRAYNDGDAKVRCRRLGLQLDGELLFVVYWWMPFSKTLADTICWVHNLFTS